jgi:hypothetical protein
MADQAPRTGPRHEPERVYERASDPAEASNRPLEPKAPGEPLLQRDEPAPEIAGSEREDPHHRLNTPVGDPHVQADSDPYRPPRPDDERDRASGSSGAHRGAEER